MDYRQFLRAAERHLLTCKQLLSKYDLIVNSCEKTYLLAEVYYLSGYILETGLSYAFFSHICYSGDVYNSSHLNTTSFKTHDLVKKYQYLLRSSCVIPDLVFISLPHNNYALQTLFLSWSVNYRYEQYPGLTKTILAEYISAIETGLNLIRTKYPL